MPKKVRTPSKNKKSQFFLFKLTFVALLLVLFSLWVYQKREQILYYFSFKSKYNITYSKKEEQRIHEILDNHTLNAIGIDVSEYQGTIDWETVSKIDGQYPIKFVLIRATAGEDRMDYQFERNWKKTKDKFIRGAYHYYRPNENSIAQAKKFIKHVKLQKGDLPPVLDIEKLPKTQSMDSLIIGLKRWLTYVEQHYQVKPIIYSGERYYEDFLADAFEEYPFWIANYNSWVTTPDDHWYFWQFTERGYIKGIQNHVDINVYNGTFSKLNRILLR